MMNIGVKLRTPKSKDKVYPRQQPKYYEGTAIGNIKINMPAFI
jgi:hypothetical protein